MTRFKVGAQFHPQHTTMDVLRAGWREADALGVDSIWTWDHFFPLYGDPDGAHFEGWSMLAAMACDTERRRVGMMVTCNSYRNPELLADMARTIDHLSHGRLILGHRRGLVRAGLRRVRVRVRHRDRSPPCRSRRRCRASRPASASLNPPPVRDPLPILIGGAGEKVTLRLVAEHASMWNSFGPPERYAKKNAILDEWCDRVGRDPKEIERTILIEHDDLQVDAYLEAGART